MSSPWSAIFAGRYQKLPALFAVFLDYFQIRIRRAAHNGFQGLDYLLVADLAVFERNFAALHSADSLDDNMVALFEFIIERVEIIDFSDLSESDSYDLGHLFHPFICRTPCAARRTYG